MRVDRHPDEVARTLLRRLAGQTTRFQQIHLMADGRFALEQIWEWVDQDSTASVRCLPLDVLIA